MSAVSKLSLKLIQLSKDIHGASVPTSGWPPPSTFVSIETCNQQIVESPMDTNDSKSTPVHINQIEHRAKVSTQTNNQPYFEKLRASLQHSRHNKAKVDVNRTNGSLHSENPLNDTFENLTGSNQHCHTWNSDKKEIQSQVDVLLSQLDLLKRSSIDNKLRKSIAKEDFEEKIQERSSTWSFPIMTPHGRVLFDFSKQAINHDIYLHLMQLIRLSNLDKFIQKIFHQSGEYHHVDYRQKRRNDLEQDEKNRHPESDHRIQRLHENSKANYLNSQSSTPIHNLHQVSNSNVPLKLYSTDLPNCYLTMAKAVHYRSLSHCFVLDGVDISSRFQYDRNIIRDTCHHFQHSTNIEIQKDNTSRTEIDQMTYKHLCSLMHRSSIDTTRTVPFILVLCTHKMKQIYQLIEALLKPYILSNISIAYVTFEEIKPFLIKYTPVSPEPFVSNTSSPSQSTVLLQSDDLKKQLNTNAEAHEPNLTNSSPEPTFRARSSETDDATDRFDVSNQDFLLNYLRFSSLVLVLMKQLDETYFRTFIQWYTDILGNSDVDAHQSSKSIWASTIEHFWLITGDYQRAQTILNMPKTNLFLWPTEQNDVDHMSIIISSILALPIALSVNYEIFTQFIDGISMIDKHCQETSIDRNICIHMALLRTWSSICERQSIGIITCDDRLQHFGKYVQMLLTEYERTVTPIHGMTTFLHDINEPTHFSYDLITIISNSSSTELSSPSAGSSYNKYEITTDGPTRPITSEFYEIEKLSRPYTSILCDQFTPLTLGILVGIYQLSIFFENILYEPVFQLHDYSSARHSTAESSNSNQQNIPFHRTNETRQEHLLNK